jgi:signal transduction histidine kinase
MTNAATKSVGFSSTGRSTPSGRVASPLPVLTTGLFVVSSFGLRLSIEGSSLSAASFFFSPLVPRFFRFLAADFGASFFAIDFGAGFFGGNLAVAFGAGFFGGDLGVAARFLGKDFGVTVGEFPASDLVVIGDMVS